MSLLGQKLPRRSQIGMSALPPKADIDRDVRNVRFGPQADILDPLNRVASVDNLICSHQHCWRYCQPECFQSLFVDHETEMGWLLEWEIGGVCAF